MKNVIKIWIFALSIITCTQAAEITLSWTDNSDNETGFSIERSVGDSPFQVIGTTEVDINRFTDTSLPVNSVVRYRVSAYNEYGSSGYTNVLVEQAFSPREPNGGVLTLMEGAVVSLIWSDNSNLESGYSVERKVNDSPYQNIAILPANTTTYRDEDAPQGNVSYRILAFNRYGQSGYAEAGTISLMPPADPSDVIFDVDEVDITVIYTKSVVIVQPPVEAED